MRSFAELGFGALLAVGALFNAIYTTSHSAEFFGSFADGAWFRPGRWLVDNLVLPNATAVTIAVIIFEAAAAVAIFTRGDLVRPALYAGAAFAFAAAVVSSPGGTVANLALGAGMLALALTR